MYTNMYTKQVHEIMITLNEYPHIPYWFTLKQAIVEIEKTELTVNGKKSLPRVILIFNEKYELIGLARRRDILKGLEPQFLSSKHIDDIHHRELFEVKIDPNLCEISFDKLLEGMKKRAEKPISEVMIPILATVDYNDHIMKVICEMVDNNISLVPVLKDGKVVGIVRSVEVFQEIANILI